MVGYYAGYALEPELDRSQPAGVSGDDDAVFIEHDRYVKTEGGYAGGYGVDRVLVVARVIDVWYELIGLEVYYFHASVPRYCLYSACLRFTSPCEIFFSPVVWSV